MNVFIQFAKAAGQAIRAPAAFPEPLRAFAPSCETSPIRNRLLRLTADSPDLLAIIKAEGKA